MCLADTSDIFISYMIGPYFQVFRAGKHCVSYHYQVVVPDVPAVTDTRWKRAWVHANSTPRMRGNE
jgi:hypothetical protein